MSAANGFHEFVRELFALVFDFGITYWIAFFKYPRSGILGDPFTQEKHGDEDKDDDGCDNLASEYIRRDRTEQRMCKETI